MSLNSFEWSLKLSESYFILLWQATEWCVIRINVLCNILHKTHFAVVGGVW